ncbi:4'-phosphopantetheinyl transferase family protein [Paracidovorax avenae]|uniref:4'-phosphopantetheinyl transferase family protein n=1 Tax=Paracidovorax avenae TaxID=80867 RepID=UPI001260394A|nr:4'-phosphopantetheinyl transferase superfamily protein [Paracidovorax avenae]
MIHSTTTFVTPSSDRVRFELFGSVLPHPAAQASLATQSTAAIDIAVVHLGASTLRTRAAQRNAQSRAARRVLRAMLPACPGRRAPRICKTALGAPYLEGGPDLRISIAHSGGWIACATAPSACVGIDIEQPRQRDWLAGAPWALHPAEIAWMRENPQQQPLQGLLHWCRKEALVKALGLGMHDSVPFPEIRFSPQGLLIEAPDRCGDVGAWNFHTRVLRSGAVMAAAWR